jgi:hypothetical protein
VVGQAVQRYSAEALRQLFAQQAQEAAQKAAQKAQETARQTTQTPIKQQTPDREQSGGLSI